MPLLIRGAIMIASIFAIGSTAGNTTTYESGSTHVSDLNATEKGIYYVLVVLLVGGLVFLIWKTTKKK